MVDVRCAVGGALVGLYGGVRIAVATEGSYRTGADSRFPGIPSENTVEFARSFSAL